MAAVRDTAATGLPRDRRRRSADRFWIARTCSLDPEPTLTARPATVPLAARAVAHGRCQNPHARLVGCDSEESVEAVMVQSQATRICMTSRRRQCQARLPGHRPFVDLSVDRRLVHAVHAGRASWRLGLGALRGLLGPGLGRDRPQVRRQGLAPVRARSSLGQRCD